MKIVRLLFALSMVAFLACDDPPTSSTSEVTGTVTYRERIALTPTAVLHLRLDDVSLQDVAATTLEEATLSNPGQVPIAFSIPYDTADIDPRNTYAVAARITDGDQLLFINTTSYPVITRGNPNHVDMVLEMVP